MVFGVFVDPSVESVQPSYFFLNISNIFKQILRNKAICDTNNQETSLLSRT